MAADWPQKSAKSANQGNRNKPPRTQNIDRINLIRLRIQETLRLAARKFVHIDGGQRAAAFSYSAFLALFPLILLLVSAASAIFGRAMACKAVINYAGKYIPLSGEMQRHVFDTISGIIQTRGEAGALAFLILIWAAAQFFTTVV